LYSQLRRLFGCRYFDVYSLTPCLSQRVNFMYIIS
jgi:hypothetical protein